MSIRNIKPDSLHPKGGFWVECLTQKENKEYRSQVKIFIDEYPSRQECFEAARELELKLTIEVLRKANEGELAGNSVSVLDQLLKSPMPESLEPKRPAKPIAPKENKYFSKEVLMLSELDRQMVIKEVLASVIPEGKDFTISTLSELINVPKKVVSDLAHRGLVYGVYKVGERFRFRYSEIMLRRATGQDIFKKPNQ